MTLPAGLHTDISEAVYHADPCPEPSLSRSVAKLLIERTPRHAFKAHPRLSPPTDAEPAEEKFDLGTAAHSMLLGRGKGIVALPFKDWRTDAAKAKREAVRAAGMVPLLTAQYERAAAMCAAVNEQLADLGLAHLFREEHGRGEVVATFNDPVAGWTRVLIDWLTGDMHVWDVKTTDIPLSPETIGRHCASMGYEFQQAFYERVLVGLYPELKGRLKFNFLFIETRDPHAVMPVQLPNDAMAKGRRQVAVACQMWRECKERGSWPLFAPGVVVAEYPPWQIAGFDDYSDGRS